MENNENETFSYTYSAQNREEIEEIRRKYLPQNEDKLETLRRLDKSAARPAEVVSLSLGIVSLLIFGAGLSIILMMTGAIFYAGIALGLVGLSGILSAHPVYNYVLKKRREKLAPEILRLTDEML